MSRAHAFPAPWGECQRCGLDYRLNAMRKEWTGLRVCAACFDPRPPELKPPRYRPEGLIRPDASPRTTPVFVEDLLPGAGGGFSLEGGGGALLLEDGGTLLQEDE